MHCYVKRLQDSVGTWGGNDSVRFASKNECDYILWNKNTHNSYALELKTTQGGSLTFWRGDFEDKTKKQSFMIKKNQIQGLATMSDYDIVAGLIINFRSEDNNTYFIPIKNFIKVTGELDKKSINEKDILELCEYTKIDNKKLKTNHRYDVGKFLEETRLY